MLVVVADTHGRDGHRLTGRTREAVHEAEVVCHLGDYATPAVLDAFEGASTAFAGVHGNNDPPAVRDRVPETRVVEHAGARLALAHGHEHSATALSLFGRQSNADLVCVGHSHAPGFGRIGETPILNPGSHADPRRHRPAHAELSVEPDRLDGELREPDGTLLESFTVER